MVVLQISAEILCAHNREFPAISSARRMEKINRRRCDLARLAGQVQKTTWVVGYGTRKIFLEYGSFTLSPGL
jgi:hypothetical protein